MLIFPQERLVIFAVPKTGTTAIDRALNAKAPISIKGSRYGKHMSVIDYKEFLEKYARSVSDGPLDFFGIIREPIDWLGSWYRYRQRIGQKNPEFSTTHISFEQFVESCLEPSPPKYAVKRKQSYFICDAEGSVAINHLFSYADMSHATAFLSERLGLEIELKEKNVSPKVPITLSDATKSRYKAQFPREFEIYDSISTKAG